MGHVQVEEVEGVIDGLDLPHLDEPQLDVLGGGRKDTLTVVVGLTDNSVLLNFQIKFYYEFIKFQHLNLSCNSRNGFTKLTVFNHFFY